jgi:hypothetical protein
MAVRAHACWRRHASGGQERTRVRHRPEGAS